MGVGLSHSTIRDHSTRHARGRTSGVRRQHRIRGLAVIVGKAGDAHVGTRDCCLWTAVTWAWLEVQEFGCASRTCGCVR